MIHRLEKVLQLLSAFLAGLEQKMDSGVSIKVTFMDLEVYLAYVDFEAQKENYSDLEKLKRKKAKKEKQRRYLRSRYLRIRRSLDR